MQGISEANERLARQRNLLIEFGGGFRRIERDMEFRAFVFLDVNRARSGGTGRRVNLHPSHHAVPRRGETAAERAVVVAAMLLARDFLAVRVGKNDGELLTGEDLVIILFLVHTQADAFVLYRLARTINRPVGEEDAHIGTDHAGAVRAGEAGGPAHVDDVRHEQCVELALGDRLGDAVGASTSTRARAHPRRSSSPARS